MMDAPKDYLNSATDSFFIKKGNLYVKNIKGSYALLPALPGACIFTEDNARSFLAYSPFNGLQIVHTSNEIKSSI